MSKRGSLASLKVKEKEKVYIPQTNDEKSKLFIDRAQNMILDQINQGIIQVNKTERKPKLRKKVVSESQEKGPINIQQDLKNLRENIDLHKKMQQQEEKEKRRMAQLLIQRIKRQKQEHKQKLRQMSQKSILYRRAFSDETINELRERLNQRITNKRIELEEKIKLIEERKNGRSDVIKQQVEYWNKIKNYESQKNIKLPSIKKEKLSDSVDIQTSRKNSLENLNRGIEPRRQKYNNIINKYLQKVKVKQEEGKARMPIFNQELDKLMIENKFSNQKIKEAGLEIKKQKRLNPMVSFAQNKPKIYGDQYLKQSLLKVKKVATQSIEKVDEEQNTIKNSHEKLELKAKMVQLSQNEIVEKIRIKWERALSKVEHDQISQNKGLELLNGLQKKLDKIDPIGIPTRLKKKYEVMQKKIQNPEGTSPKTLDISLTQSQHEPLKEKYQEKTE